MYERLSCLDEVNLEGVLLEVFGQTPCAMLSRGLELSKLKIAKKARREHILLVPCRRL